MGGLLLVALAPLAAAAQTNLDRAVAAANRPHYRLKVDVPWQLEEAAAEGYIMVANSNGVLLLEDSGSPHPAIEYNQILAGGLRELERELDAAGADGYRVAPQTLGEVTRTGLFVQRTISRILLARTPGETRQFEFRVLVDKNIPALQMQLNRANAEGFEVALIGWTKGALVILERMRRTRDNSGSLVPPAEGGRRAYLLIETRRTSTFLKELNQAGAAGYRFLAYTNNSERHVGLLEKPLEEEAPPRSNLLVAASRDSTLEKELNAAAGRGYRLLPSGVGYAGFETLVVLEQQPPQAPRYRYRVLGTNLLGTLEREIAEAGLEGYQPVGLAGKRAIVEKAEEPRP